MVEYEQEDITSSYRSPKQALIKVRISYDDFIGILQWEELISRNSIGGITEQQLDLPAAKNFKIVAT
jgi:hypothetical protein